MDRETKRSKIVTEFDDLLSMIHKKQASALLKALKTFRFDEENDSTELLAAAVNRGACMFQVVQYLVAKRSASVFCQVGRNRDSLMHVAVRRGDRATANFLSANGLSVNVWNKKFLLPVHMVRYKTKTAVDWITFFAKRKCKMNVCSFKGTPLHMAVKAKNHDLVLLMTRGGVKIDTPDFDGMSPLCVAVLEQDEKTVKFLLSRKASPNYRCGEITPMHCWARTSVPNPRTLALLVRSGGKVDCRTESNDTAFSWCVRKQKFEHADVLFANGANPHARNKQGFSVAEWTHECQGCSLCEKIRSYVRRYLMFVIMSGNAVARMESPLRKLPVDVVRRFFRKLK